MQRRYEEHDTAEPAPHQRDGQLPNRMKRVSFFPPKLGFDSISNMEGVPPPAKSALIPEGEKDKSEY